MTPSPLIRRREKGKTSIHRELEREGEGVSFKLASEVRWLLGRFLWYLFLVAMADRGRDKQLLA